MIKLGVIGCGNISGIYFQNLTAKYPFLKIKGCYDLDGSKAEAAAKANGILAYPTLDALLSDGEIDAVLNITIPKAHYEVCRSVLEAGKHVYVEKPLSLSFAQGKELYRLAEEKGLRIGCAPDTFLGAGISSCKAALDEGKIGKPLGGSAFMICRGHESWHPSPEFYYKPGGGPLFDMGPYYVTALTYLLGSVEQVFAYNAVSFPQRTITSAPKFGQKIDVEVNTHDTALLKFRCGASVTMTMSFDVYAHSLPNLEIYGTEGTLSVGDPNGFCCDPKIFTGEKREFLPVPLVNPYTGNERGIGLAQMCLSIEKGGVQYASGARGLHVLEVMEAIETSGRTGRPVFMTTDAPEADAFRGI